MEEDDPNFLQGLEYEKNQDFENAIMSYKKAMNHTGALLNLACIYEKLDMKKAIEYNEMAKNLGSGDAYFNLGCIYFDYVESPENKKKSFENFFIAADEYNFPEAQLNVGWFYSYGIGGIEKDFEKAEYWFRKAMNQKENPFLSETYYNLGTLYIMKYGKDVIKTNPEVTEWFELAEYYEKKILNIDDKFLI